MIRLFNAFIILAVINVAAMAQYKDYSEKGAGYELLKDIKLDVVKIDSTGAKQISVEGEVLDVASFAIVGADVVPFEEGYNPYNNVMKDLHVHYELLVGKDERNLIHDKLIAVLKTISSRAAGERDFSNVGLVSGKSTYLLYSGPATMPNYVWLDGRVIVVRFIRITERRRDRPFDTETFWKQKIRLYSAGERLSPSRPSKSFADDFLKRYAAGDFQRTRKNRSPGN